MVEGGTSRDRKLAKMAAWAALDDPDHWFNELIELLVASSIDYLTEQVRAGAEVLQVFETWASDLPDVLFEKYCIGPIARIVSGVRTNCPGVPVIGFPRGGGQFVRGFCEQVKPDGLGCDWGMRAGFASGVDVQGNGAPAL